ncbi:hypothetical protein BD410DRAFT_203463 [Rickenella mellea]|uniref:Aminoglycoside phosphotransferase domain-containing protein n=1 Tax=Rickenella mellea TaxID=50990 RepID=A0A4Y7PIV7_9AGAM|nr:hypothetical protein BD410DRAFT_203463 [Rickenella mellea]
MSSSMKFAALEPAIVCACAQHERENENVRNYRHCLLFGQYFVKFGAYSSFYSEVMTLSYLADLAKTEATAPRVPQVHHFFHNNGGMAYVVMEYICLAQVSAETLAAKAAQAVRWMHGVPAPHDVVLGPKGNGRARHVVFKNCKAPLDFVSLGALERYFNKAVAKARHRSPTIADISIAKERLVLTQSDMNTSNFGVDAAGRPVVLDFGEIGWLPESLDLYTLLRTTAFARKVAEHLFGPDEATSLCSHPNLASMSEIRALLAMAARPNLNLDNNGYERTSS